MDIRVGTSTAALKIKREKIKAKFKDELHKQIGAVLKLIGGDAFIDKIALRQFLLSCQCKYGGFSKFPGALPDLYHSYYGYTAFSFLEEPGLSPLCHELGLPLLTALGI
ncbi:BnaC04g05920D [Brassica napus]|uniref:BnaC04g05920D protein n=2 Tax=Brassica TaxID=3705 RepID=A0A078G676_BRANA|nr:BnaC04g05920D [Brassica napus]